MKDAKNFAEKMKAVGGDPDLECKPGQEHFTSHSLRRLADTVARRDMEETGTSKEDIDLFLGWHEKALLLDMQRHYEGLSMRQRMKKARITSRL